MSFARDLQHPAFADYNLIYVILILALLPRVNYGCGILELQDKRTQGKKIVDDK